MSADESLFLDSPLTDIFIDVEKVSCLYPPRGLLLLFTHLERHWLPCDRPMTQPYTSAARFRPRSLATVQNRIAQAAIFFRNLDLDLFSPGVFDHIRASNRGGLVVSLLITTFTNLPFNRI